MLTLIYAADGNRAFERANAHAIGYGGAVGARQINAYCGIPERCTTLIMLDPSPRVEREHIDCDIIREYEVAAPEVELDRPAAVPEPQKEPKRRGRKPNAR